MGGVLTWSRTLKVTERTQGLNNASRAQQVGAEPK